ncbi:hypothetical protein HELRODRAFT_162311 [Helobdella robusta]|uniref:Uncharacterized protein n=1 Tax=Helobdella robusta TaxID=6412 RepID=T1ESI0_HELRO|nr:hypothetical protein HELRODRAFT_162311 [Helobdella robusta]ESN98851.1 hypothetical protein HELRODRAFT_162311 [Helobdella robusta]
MENLSCQRIFSVVENRHQPPDNLISGSSSGSLKNRKQNTANKHNFNVRNKEPLIVCSDPQPTFKPTLPKAMKQATSQHNTTHTTPTHAVLGCADYKTNDANMWTKRINDVTAIGCHSDDELTRWKLNCVLDQWLGDVGRCEESGTSDVLSSRGGEQLKITSVLSFIIVVCISFIIGLCVLIVGLVWMHSSNMSKNIIFDCGILSRLQQKKLNLRLPMEQINNGNLMQLLL